MKKRITHYLTNEHTIACNGKMGGASGWQFTRDSERDPVTCKRCLAALKARKYDVHIFTVVRVKVAGVVARDMVEAMKKAEEEIAFHRLFDRDFGEDKVAHTEWAEEHSHALVDKKIDKDFEHSTWFKGDLKTKMEVK